MKQSDAKSPAMVPRQPGKASVPYSEATDAELVAQVREGDREAFGALISRYGDQARRVARSVIRDPDDADDAAQDGFLNALRRLSKYDERRPFGPWLLRVVANAATDRARRRAVRAAEPLHDRYAATTTGPLEDTERRLLFEQLAEALEGVPKRRRMAVVLFDVEGYSHREIAEILGVREGTVRSDVFHARRYLRAALATWKESE